MLTNKEILLYDDPDCTGCTMIIPRQVMSTDKIDYSSKLVYGTLLQSIVDKDYSIFSNKTISKSIPLLSESMIESCISSLEENGIIEVINHPKYREIYCLI